MKRLLIIITVIILSNQAFAQVYKGFKRGINYFADVRNDNARVEAFRYDYPDFYYKDFDEVLKSVNTGSDTLYSGKNAHIIHHRNKYYLIYKTTKVRLDTISFKELNYYRNKVYESTKRIEVMHLEDSLRSSHYVFNPNINNTFRLLNKDIPDSTFKILADRTSDSLINIILKIHKPKFDYYVRMGDSIDKLDTTTIFNLLANTEYNYNISSSMYFLYKLALKKPEYLIQYIDKNPPNKNSILDAIKDSKVSNFIIDKVKEVNVNTEGKRGIVKQRVKRIRENTVAITVYTLIVVGEIALLVFLGTLIF